VHKKQEMYDAHHMKLYYVVDNVIRLSVRSSCFETGNDDIRCDNFICVK
jgi:hypothetical protein